MNIQLLSDVHLEAHPQWHAQPLAGADLLVLAGDIGSYQKGSLLTGPDFGLERFSPRNGWPTPVIFVPGNHEYDAQDFDAAQERLRATCERLGLIWLERSSVQLAGVRFIGTTLWTDFDALGPSPEPGSEPEGPNSSNPTAAPLQQAIQRITEQTPNLLARQLKAREQAFRAANFYLRKTQTTRHGQPLLAQDVRALGLECQEWLRAALAQPFAGPTVVVTHFSPSLRSADPRYGHTPGTAGFCNALDDLLPLAQLWLHGHLHAPSDYRHRGCRVVANPLGYARKREQDGFSADLLIEVG